MGIAGLCYQAWFTQCWGSNLVLVHARLSLPAGQFPACGSFLSPFVTSQFGFISTSASEFSGQKRSLLVRLGTKACLPISGRAGQRFWKMSREFRLCESSKLVSNHLMLATVLMQQKPWAWDNCAAVTVFSSICINEGHGPRLT